MWPLEDSTTVAERVCSNERQVVYVWQPFALDEARVPCLTRPGVQHNRFRQYARGNEMTLGRPARRPRERRPLPELGADPPAELMLLNADVVAEAELATTLEVMSSPVSDQVSTQIESADEMPVTGAP